jgi:hypothetical protein
MERKPRPVVDASARCACGAVSLRFAGKVLSMFMCSCEDCQKATGAGHSAILLARPGDVTITGETRSFARPANSGAVLSRAFCPQCGTPLYGQSSRAPDMRMVPVGFFAGQNDWFHPNQLIFARRHQEWDLVADHLPQHETYREA